MAIAVLGGLVSWMVVVLVALPAAFALLVGRAGDTPSTVPALQNPVEEILA